MSWLFSRALVEAYSAERCLAGGPCAQLNVMPTARPFLRRGKTMDVSSPFQFGLTSTPLTEQYGGELLTLYLAGFPVRTSLPPARAPGSMGTRAACGTKWPGSFAKWSLDSYSWRTPQLSLAGGLESFSGVWPRSGSMRNGMCSARPRLVLLTDGNASGSLLPTPSGVNGGNNNTMGRIDEWGGSSNPLRGTVIGSMCLPEFEELVMGWPIGWTALTRCETGKFHEWQQQHSPLSQPSLSKEAA
jgi:hypothetical protein